MLYRTTALAYCCVIVWHCWNCASCFALDCEGIPSVHFWLSPTANFSSPPQGVPLVNSGNATSSLYLYVTLPSGEGLTDFSLDILADSDAFQFTSAFVLNPQVELNGVTSLRFEHTPAAWILPDRVTSLQGFTVTQTSATAIGISESSKHVDPEFASGDTWRIAKLEFERNLNSSAEDTAMWLQLGTNGIQGKTIDGQLSPEYPLIFGDAGDSPLCSLTARGLPSSRPDARIVSDPLPSGTMSHSGSFWQADSATLSLSVGDVGGGNFEQLVVTGPAHLGGTLGIELLPDFQLPQVGESLQATLVQGAPISGRFESVLVNGNQLGSTFQTGTQTRSHQGDGLFWIADQSTSQFLLGPYQAILGDANGDRSVDFADFLLLSGNFNQSGSWIDGDFSGNGLVGFEDFLTLAAAFGNTAGSSAAVATIPEPHLQRWLILAALLWIHSTRSAFRSKAIPAAAARP